MQTKTPPATAKTEFDRNASRVTEALDKMIQTFIQAMGNPTLANVEKAHEMASSYVDRKAYFIANWTVEGTRLENKKREAKPKRKWKWPKEETSNREKAIDRLESSRVASVKAIQALVMAGAKKGNSNEEKHDLAVAAYAELTVFHGRNHFVRTLWNPEGKWIGPNPKKGKKKNGQAKIVSEVIDSVAEETIDSAGARVETAKQEESRGTTQGKGDNQE